MFEINSNFRVIKSGIWYTISNFLVKSIGFITTPIFTRLLTKEEFGLFNNYTSWVSIMTIFVTLNLESTLISARYDFEKKFDEYILSMLCLSSMSSIFWLLIMNIFPQNFSSMLGLNNTYINVMLVYLLFLPAINLYQARERYYFEYKKSVLISILLSISTALLSVVMVCIMSRKLMGRILGAAIPTILIGVVLYLWFLYKGKKIKVIYWKYALPICLPYIPHLLSLTLLYSMDKVMITRWCGAEQNALYSLAYTCGMIVTLLLTSMNSAYAPWIGEKLAKKDYKDIFRWSKPYINLFFMFSILIMAVSPEILLILGGKAYMGAIYAMPPVTVGCVMKFLYTMFVNVEQFEKKTIGMAIASVTATVINFILNSIFIPKYGFIAAAYTTLFGYFVLLLIHMFLVYKMGLNHVYSYKHIFLILGMEIFVMLFLTIIYQSIIRYIFIIAYLIIIMFLIIKNKDKLKVLVKGIIK